MALGGNTRATLGSDGNMYFAGSIGNGVPNNFGTNVLRYDPTTDTWTYLAASLAIPQRAEGMATGPDGRVYAIAGAIPANSIASVEVYGPDVTLNPASGNADDTVGVSGGNFAPNATVSIYWGTPTGGGTLVGSATTTDLGNLPPNTSFIAPAGITDGSYTVTLVDNVSMYPVYARFTVAPPTSSPPYWVPGVNEPLEAEGRGAAVGLDGRTYISGGCNGSYPSFNTEADVYDPATGTWTAIAPMPVGRCIGSDITGPDGRIYAIGGYGVSEVDAYTPATNTWAAVAPLPFTGATAAAMGPDGRIYVAECSVDSSSWAYCSAASNGDPAGAMWAYNFSSNTWSSVASMPGPRAYLALVTGPDGRIYAMGGVSDATGTWTNEVDAYTPSTNTWTTVSPMITARQTFRATVGADGRIYAMGGYNGNPVAAAEAYTPATNTWTSVAPLLAGRWDSAVVTGPDGRIYTLGGFEPYGGSAGCVCETDVYGPVFTPSTSSGTAGSSITLSGSNFGANANVTFYWGTAVTGTVLGTGTTDGSGNLNGSVSVTVPANAAPGTYIITAEDAASRYPVNEPFTVTGSAPRRAGANSKD